MKLSFKILGWLALALITLSATGFYGYRLRSKQDVFLPGKTSAGHYQFETDCKSCHTPFGGVQQDACLKCHGEELAAVSDSHPKRLFTDPRNASQVSIVDARLCITCHQEHRPDITKDMGFTQTVEFCVACHDNMAAERPSHRDFPASGCASSGCHNYHDNTALYEEFLEKHAHDPVTMIAAKVPLRNLHEWTLRSEANAAPKQPATIPDADAIQLGKPALAQEWAASAHAQADINCKACHQPKSRGGKIWSDVVPRKICAECHSPEEKGFLAGKHGARQSVGLPPMSPGLARQPMIKKSREKELTCRSCHGSHSFDTQKAAADACMGCHDDLHTQAFKKSPHYKLWEDELAGRAAKGTGVSCATCHLPRDHKAQDGFERIMVNHNQSDNLRPNEKMLRGVCMNCHELGFSIDALADAALVNRNFVGKPAKHVPSIDMVIERKSQRAK